MLAHLEDDLHCNILMDYKRNQKNLRVAELMG